MKKIHTTLLLLMFSIILTGCISKDETSSFLIDMNEAGFSTNFGINLGECSYEDQLIYYNDLYSHIDVNFENIYTFEDDLTSDFGYIYNIEESTQLALFFQNRKDYSSFENNIIFVYLVDNYVLEVYHSVNSTFPGFLRHYKFEANYQYYTFYTDEIIYPPIISKFLNNGSSIQKVYTVSELIEFHNEFNNLNIPMRKVYKIYDSTMYASIFVIEVNSINDAILVYQNQADLFFPVSNSRQIFVQYQNLVLHIYYILDNESELLNTILGSTSYEMYHEYDIG
jgi:hypothetical protein